MAETVITALGENTLWIFIVVLIILFASLIVLIRKKRYDAAIGLAIAIAAYIAMIFLRTAS